MKIIRRRRAVAAVAATAVAALGWAVSPSGAAAAGEAKVYVGFAFDVRSSALDGTVLSGPVAPAGVNCSPLPLSDYNSAVNANLAGVSLGTVNNSSVGTVDGDIQTTTSTFQATGVGINLGVATGLTADAITMTTTTSYNKATGSFTSGGTMNVTNLAVQLAGQDLLSIASGPVDPNTLVGIPGVATIQLNQRDIIGDGANLSGQVGTAIRLKLLGATATVGVGEVLSALQDQPTQVLMNGAGLGAQVSVGGLATVGPLVIAGVPCYGTGGNEVSAVSVGGPLSGVGQTGVITSTAKGTVSDASASATTSSEVNNLNLLSGVVTADLIKATTTVSTTDAAATVSKSHETVLANLDIAGINIPAEVPVNSVVEIPGVGWVLLNVQLEDSSYADGQTIALWLHVNATNTDVYLANSVAKLVPSNPAAAAIASRSMALSSDADSEVKRGQSKKATSLSATKGKATASSLKQANDLLKKLADTGASQLETTTKVASLGTLLNTSQRK